VVVAILEGVCREMSQREAQTLQRARLHVLERAGRWKEVQYARCIRLAYAADLC